MGVDLLTNRAVSCSCLPACFEIAYTKVSTTAMLGDGTFNTNNPIFLEKSHHDIKYYFNCINNFFFINFNNFWPDKVFQFFIFILLKLLFIRQQRES